MNNKKIKKIILAIVLVVFIECTLFNFRYYFVNFSKLGQKDIEINESNLIDISYDGYKFQKKYFIDLNEEIKSVKVNLQNTESEDVVITPKFTDESAKYMQKELDELTYNKKYKNSEYFVLESQGDCIHLELDIVSKNQVSIESITINKWYFSFNIYRVILLIIITVLILYGKEINDFFEKTKNAKKYFYSLFIILFLVGYSIYASGYPKLFESLLSVEHVIYKDAYKSLTESILRDKKVDINFPKEHIEQLEQLDNYKDRTEREAKNVSNLFDFAFYNGKYYCYFGIVPVLTVFIPIALITGIYIYSNIACVIFATLIMLIFLKIYYKLIEKFELRLGFLLEFLGFLALFLSSGIYVCMGMPSFYQAAEMSGIMWGLIATLLILNMDNEKKLNLKLFFTGISYGLMVCSRPNLILYIIPLLIGVFKYIVNNKKINIKRATMLFIPITVIAILQMWYNYIRFDNPLEFGQFYQLTINDTSKQKMDLGMALDGIQAYLFNPPELERTYPYLTAKYPKVRNGNVIFDGEVYGLIWFPYYIILFSIFRRIKNNKTKEFKLLSISIIIIAILILAITTCLAGMNQRYLTDVQPAIALLSCACWFIYLTESKNEEVRKNNTRLYRTLCCIVFIVMMIYSRYHITKSLINASELKIIDIESIDYQIKNVIEFYK